MRDTEHITKELAIETLELVYKAIIYEKGKDIGTALNSGIYLIEDLLPHLKDTP